MSTKDITSLEMVSQEIKMDIIGLVDELMVSERQFFDYFVNLFRTYLICVEL